MEKKKILVVEDDSDINEALCIRLRGAGYDVVSAEDGLHGMLRAVKERPDLLLLDISMPGGDGFSIVERLRDHTDAPAIPVVFLTASKRPELRQKAKDLGAVALLEKPYEASELLATIRETIAGGWCLTL